MRYYREIELDQFEIIQQKLIEYSSKVLENKKINTIGYYSIRNYSLLLEEIPELVAAFAKYNLNIRSVAFYITNKPTVDYVPKEQPIKNLAHTVKNPIHTDIYHHKARINIPVLNTRGTFTRFFTNCKLKPWKNPISGTEFELITNTDYIEVDSVEILKTTVIRVQEPHMVQLYEGLPLPRITITIGFDRDPVYLLEENF